MKIKEAVAASIVSAALVLGVGASVASAAPADSASSTATATTKGSHCQDAKARLEKLRDLRHRLELRIDRLQKARDIARDHHRDELVKKLEVRIDKAQARRVALEGRIAPDLGCADRRTT